jgi:hypothetical protein
VPLEVTVLLAHWEGFLLVGEDTGSHLEESVTSVVAIFRHSVVAEDHESCLVIHKFDNFGDEGLSLKQFTLNLGVSAAESVSGAVKTDHVSEHEVKIAAGFKLF